MESIEEGWYRLKKMCRKDKNDFNGEFNNKSPTGDTHKLDEYEKHIFRMLYINADLPTPDEIKLRSYTSK